MQVTFYGVRGSLPSPGADYVKYGGNTACVHVALNDGTDIILDAGSGIRALGNQLAKSSDDIHLLLSHNHWDHVQGFPFFTPIYQKDRNIYITPGLTEPAQYDAVLTQMSDSHFPVNYQDLPSNIQIQQPTDKHDWQIGNAKVRRIQMNHPGKGSAYLIKEDQVCLAYITDNELYPPYQKSTDFLDWVSFAAEADLIIHDAQYIQPDMPTKSGWGHSIAEEAVKLAMASRAKRLALYSHDPCRTDQQIDQIVAYCQELLDIAESQVELIAAAEGMQISL